MNKAFYKFISILCLATVIHLTMFSSSYADTNEQLNIELRSLEQFDDIAVIQRKYLRKTERFEVWGSALTSLNSQLFNIFGIAATGTYHFNERWGLEASFLFSTDLEKSFTEGLRENYFISSTDLVTPSSYMGLHLRWSPVYGKISLRATTITPFELYFTIGGGVTGTDDGQSAPTFHLGVGQFYPLSKNMTFRWGLGFNVYQAESKAELVQDREDITAFMLFLSGGVSWYFPFTEER